MSYAINEPRFRMIGHACVLATYYGKSILFDPWFGRTVNYGTFSGYPRFSPPTELEKQSIIAIHISHIHFDHFCPEDLEAYSKDIPILISRYLNPDFVTSIKRAGFTNIVQVGSGKEKFQIGPFTLSCFPKLPEDGSFDSSCVIEIAEKNYYLNNDCIHNDILYHLLSHLFGEFQGAFLGYAAANPLPWGTDYSECSDFRSNTQKDTLSLIWQKMKWEHVSRISRILKPKWAVPYASSYRFLAADLAHLNSMFGTDEQIYDIDLGQTTPVVLKHGDTILCESGDRKNSAGESVTEKSPASSPVVPKEFQRPELFSCSLNETEFSTVCSEASEFFRELFSRQSRTWSSPMAIEIQIFCGPKVRSFFYGIDDGTARILSDNESPLMDAIVKLPAVSLRNVLNKKMSLASFYYLFCTEVRWKSWKYGQSNFVRWL